MDRSDALWTLAEADRREAAAGGTATGHAGGFALSTQPVAAQTLVVTDTAGIEARMDAFACGGTPIPVYLAHPKAGGRCPVVVVVQEIFGLHEHIQDVCRRLAKEGYLALAPALYHRQGDVASLKTFDEIRPIVAKVPDAQVMADIDEALRFAAKAGPADTSRVGITGFCWGGRIVWLYAAHRPSIKAGVAWYGRLAGDRTASTPTQPIDVAAGLTVPVLGLYGGADAGIPVATVDEMRAALGAGSASRIHVYPEAPHAFFADYRPSYRDAEAKDGWQRMLAWFQANGLGKG
ncbi:MAG: dienelactone hydrolase family protein [Hyphomicrobiaceae bacterium]|nr:dienelactone hydrolase family protein [Hyphomicrobiaceae bacterium]